MSNIPSSTQEAQFGPPYEVRFDSCLWGSYSLLFDGYTIYELERVTRIDHIYVLWQHIFTSNDSDEYWLQTIDFSDRENSVKWNFQQLCRMVWKCISYASTSFVMGFEHFIVLISLNSSFNLHLHGIRTLKKSRTSITSIISCMQHWSAEGWIWNSNIVSPHESFTTNP